MLRLLLDEHLSPKVVRQLGANKPGLRILSLQEWHGGVYLGVRDELLLRAAGEQSLTLVTYDRRTIAPLLKSWAEQGISHGGVIFVDDRTLAPNDLGGLVNALAQLWEEQRKLCWKNRVVFLRRATRQSDRPVAD